MWCTHTHITRRLQHKRPKTQASPSIRPDRGRERERAYREQLKSLISKLSLINEELVYDEKFVLVAPFVQNTTDPLLHLIFMWEV